MAGKRKKIVDIDTLIQHLRAGDSNRRIKRDLGIDRRTVRKYREWAAEYGLLSGSLPPIEELYQLMEETMPTQQPPQSQSTVEPYRKQVVKLREQGVEISAIKARLEERGFAGSYMAIYRFVRQLEPIRPDVTVRVETQRQWSDLAIARTTPTILGLFSLVTLLAYRLTKDKPFPVRTSAWYVKKEPAFSDALAVVRRHIWFGLWGKSVESAPDPDYVLIPASVFNGLVDSICYST